MLRQVLFQMNAEFMVTWSDIPSFEGKNLQSLIDLESRPAQRLFRWALSHDIDELSLDLKLIKHPESGYRGIAWKSGEFFYLRIQELTHMADHFDFGENFWRVFTQSFPGGLLFVGKHFEIAEISLNIMNYLKLRDRAGILYSKESLIGKNILELLGSNGYFDFKDDFEIQLKRARDSKNIVESPQVIFHNGHYFKTFFCEIADKGHHRGYCIYLFDKTQEIAKDRQIEIQQQQLFVSSKLASLGEMAGGIAHEINNPLAIITGASRLLEKFLKQDPIEVSQSLNCLDIINNTLTRMSKIVTGMRTISHSQMDDRIEDVCLREIFDDVLGVTSEKLRILGVELRICDVALDERVICSRVPLSQVLINLISNSRDAIQNDDVRWIKISLEPKENVFCIRVSDSGLGIPKVLQDKIFHPFYTTKDLGKGTGLGLSISKTLMEKQKGKIYIDDEAPNTTFVLELPRSHTHFSPLAQR